MTAAINDPLVGKPTLPVSPEFRFVAAYDLPVKPIAWLVHKIIEADTLAVMFGAPGEGKSFLALDLSCCIATGTDFHGHEVEQGAVFYIAGEGHNGIARRLKAWSTHNDVSLSGAPLYVSEGATDLASATNAAMVAEAVQRLAKESGATPVMIVVDTLARNFGGDENKATDVGQFVRHVDDHLRRKWKATTLIVHHSGKDGDRGARGSSALKGAADAEYAVSRNEDDKVIRLIPRKMKDSEEPPPMAFQLVGVSVLDDDGQNVGGAALKVTEYTAPPRATTAGMGSNQQKALAILEEMHTEIAERLAGQGRSEHEVLVLTEDWQKECEAAEIKRNRFKEVRDGLVKRKAIRFDGPHVYLIAEAVRNVRNPLDESDDSDSQEEGSFGQIGQDSDAIRTDAEQHPVRNVRNPLDESDDSDATGFEDF
jgi:hypothetical protein